MSEPEKTVPMPCPLCGADLLPESDGYEHPGDDTCPLDALYLEARHIPAWNTRAAAAPSETLAQVRALLEALRDSRKSTPREVQFARNALIDLAVTEGQA